MPATILEGVTAALTQRRGGSAVGAVFDELMVVAARGDEAEVARLCEGLPEQPRFVLVLAGGLLHPEAFRSAALAADQALPRGEALKWTQFCARELARHWALAMAPHLPVEVIAGLLARDVYAARPLQAAVEGRAARGELEPARVLYGAMSWYVKAAKAAARAAIALSPATRALGEGALLAELEAAIADATKEPIIESGGEEVEALAELLSVLIGSGVIGPEHPALESLLQRLHSLRSSHPKEKDKKSWGYMRAASFAADAASEQQPGWLAVAERITKDVWKHEEELAPKLEAARARVAGPAASPAPATPATPATPAAAPALAELAGEQRFDRRSSAATELAVAAWARADRQGYAEALRVAIAPPPAGLAPPERVTLSAHYLARALEQGDAQAPRGWSALPARWAAAEALQGADLIAIAGEVERALGAPERRQLAGAFSDAVIPTPLLFQHKWPPFGGLENATFVTVLLARLLAPLNDPERELALLRAAAHVQKYEDQPASQAAQARRARLERALEALAAALPPAALQQRLPRWREALAPTPEFECAIARFLPVAEASAMLASLADPSHYAVELCAAWARAGHFDDALALTKKCNDNVHALALCEMALAPLDAKQSAALLKAFEKCPKGGRDKDTQVLWRHRRARVRLRLGRVEEAIEALPSIGQGAYAGTGPVWMAREIAAALDGSNTWTEARALALLNALVALKVANAEALYAVIPAAWPHAAAPEAALALFREPAFEGDAGAVDLAAGAGLVRTGDLGAAAQRFEQGVERLLCGRRRHVEPSLVFRALRELAAVDSQRAAPLFARCYGLFQNDDRNTGRKLVEVMHGVTEPELGGVLAGLGTLPAAFAEPARDALARGIATRLSCDQQALELLLELVRSAPDLVSSERRAAWLGVALAKSEPQTARALAEATRILA